MRDRTGRRAHRRAACWVWWLIGALSVVPLPADEGFYPLLDGVCDEYERIASLQWELPHEIVLSIFQDQYYVWICYSLPPGSYGTLDLTLDAPLLEETLNLHVSAQIGEWRSEHPEEAPRDPSSDRWWRYVGWTSNPVRLNGYEEGESGRRGRFLPSEGRELQLSKDRFGRGRWGLRFEIRSIKVGEDQETVVYPKDPEGEPGRLILDVR